MPGELTGPFPPASDPASYDRLRRRVLWRMPTGLFVLGSASGERRNFMTHSLAMQVSVVPKLVGVAVSVSSLTHQLLSEGGAFSLCFLRREDKAVVRAFTKPAQRGPLPDIPDEAQGPVEGAVGTLGGHLYRIGSTGVPLLACSPAWLECLVRNAFHVGDHTLFVGEVVDCAAPDEQGEVLRMEDTRLNYGG